MTNIDSLLSPLEQFEIVNRGLFRTNSNRIMMLSRRSIVRLHQVTMPQLGGHGLRVPTRLQLVAENLYSRVSSIVIQTIGNKGEKYYPFVYTLIRFVLTINVLGLVPYGFTSTSHLSVTLTLALMVWIGKRLLGLRNHGRHLFGIILPAGTPIPLVPRRVPLERISFCITFISLSVRLFANIIAGHILLKVIGGFSWSLRIGSANAGIVMGRIMFLMHRLPRIVLLILIVLESGVAFIQAYVFALLSCIYIADTIEGGH